MQINPSITLSNIGGKAYQLYRLKKCSKVPPFFVVSFDDPNEIDDPTIQDAIVKHCNTEGFTLLAVRSSASTEDSIDASFAGMFLTILGVRSNGLIEGIKSVLGSVKSARVSSYAEARGYDINEIKMAVIIQEIVQSRVSGVCFTRFRDNKDQIIIEACYGLGELLVSGLVNPDRYVINRNTLNLEEETIGYQTILLSISQQNGIQLNREQIPFHKRNARKLTHEELRKVSETCLSVERHLSIDPADIEWAFEGDNLYILQARPYTGIVYKNLPA